MLTASIPEPSIRFIQWMTSWLQIYPFRALWTSSALVGLALLLTLSGIYESSYVVTQRTKRSASVWRWAPDHLVAALVLRQSL
jgi:hypothetical protein